MGMVMYNFAKKAQFLACVRLEYDQKYYFWKKNQVFKLYRYS